MVLGPYGPGGPPKAGGERKGSFVMQQGLILHYTLHPDGAHLVRVLGDTPSPVLPDTLGGAPLTQIGSYAFSASSQKAVAQGAQLEEQIGQAPASAVPLCGDFLQSVTLPDTVQVLGNAAFYNCRKLEHISMGVCITAVGSDLFSNCRALHRLELRAAPDAPTGLRRVINALSGDVLVQMKWQGQVLAGLRYPEFWEELEENAPAHIFQRGIRGRGYHYRQCFAEEAVNFAEFDRVFPMAVPEEEPSVLAGLALARLRWPWALGQEADAQYRAFLAAHGALAARDLIAAQDLEGLQVLCDLQVMSPVGREEALEFARAKGAAQAAALLARVAAPAKKSYDFD